MHPRTSAEVRIRYQARLSKDSPCEPASTYVAHQRPVQRQAMVLFAERCSSSRSSVVALPGGLRRRRPGGPTSEPTRTRRRGLERPSASCSSAPGPASPPQPGTPLSTEISERGLPSGTAVPTVECPPNRVKTSLIRFPATRRLLHMFVVDVNTDALLSRVLVASRFIVPGLSVHRGPEAHQ
jgi:hypothetical protein